MADDKKTSENEMADIEIIKALNDYVRSTERIKHGGTKRVIVYAEFLKGLLDLTNRQQAKIDRLTCDYGCYKVCATDIVEHQKEQIESLIAGQKTLQKYIVGKDAEIERLKGRLESSDKQLEEMKESNGRLYLRFNTAQNKGIKEFSERFLKKIHENHYMLSDKHNSTDKGMFTIGIEQAVAETKKEMVGDTE